ncbi:DUF6879 family protein [Nonomuraea sp. NPDC050556]|uniref:DUF6879 family protein n=1 Tax=Nonomuraea sp. NPDC050556 TaxID=3364369 RepID=UPI00379166CA
MTFVSGDGFTALFRDFTRTAFRLEVRDQYDAPDEVERFRKFLAGEGYDTASRLAAPWWQMIHKATSEQGKQVRRVRVVTEPHGDYTRYALVGARINLDGGEDIRYLPRDRAREIGLPEHDFWLFDERLVAWMHFDDNGALTSTELIEEPAVVEQHLAWQALAWEHAIPYDDYIR